VAIKKI
jgi:hypothetical protein